MIKTGKLNSFPQSKLTYGFPFRKTPSTQHKPQFTLQTQEDHVDFPYSLIYKGGGVIQRQWCGITIAVTEMLAMQGINDNKITDVQKTADSFPLMQ